MVCCEVKEGLGHHNFLMIGSSGDESHRLFFSRTCSNIFFFFCETAFLAVFLMLANNLFRTLGDDDDDNLFHRTFKLPFSGTILPLTQLNHTGLQMMGLR